MYKTIGIVLSWILMGAVPCVSGEVDRRESGARQSASLRSAADGLWSLHTRKSSPKPGDWLVAHDEPGQTFDEYRSSRPNRPDAQRTTLYVQPLGELSASHQRIVRATEQILAVFFDLPVKTLEPLPLDVVPAKARRMHPIWGDRQLLTTHILYNVLRPRRPADAVAVLALTSADLWPGDGWNFVFGQADLKERVGVWSLYRNGDPDEGNSEYLLCLRRSLKTATHETGHMLGVTHCTAYECGMNGANHRVESDRRPLAWCPECVQKIWWACDSDPVRRFEALVRYARQHALDDEARIWARSLDKTSLDKTSLDELSLDEAKQR